MGRVHVVLDDKLEEDLRKKAAKTFGLRKGAISDAVSVAVKDWLKKK